MPKPNNAPQVNILRPCYAMASTDGQTADITMYGEIVETQPIDWWTDEPIPGQYIIESEFLSDLQQVENCPQIIIRMDSLGGDAGVSVMAGAFSERPDCEGKTGGFRRSGASRGKKKR